MSSRVLDRTTAKVTFLFTELEKAVGIADVGVCGHQEFCFSATFDVTDTEPGGDVEKAAG